MSLPEQSSIPLRQPAREWVIRFSMEHREETISGPFAWDERVVPRTEWERLRDAANAAYLATREPVDELALTEAILRLGNVLYEIEKDC